MRTNEERIAVIHKRAAEIEKANRHNRVRFLQMTSLTVGLLVVIALAFAVPNALPETVPSMVTESMRGSMFAENGMLGFIVIGILSFFLGVSVTVFCFRLKKWRDAADSEQIQEHEQENNT